MDTKKLRQKILDLAIHGKLVPQDPNDEPASVLRDTSHYPKEGPWELPEGWCWTTIDDIAFVTKLAGFEYTEFIANNLTGSDGVPLFKGKNVQDGKIIYKFESYIPKAVSDKLPRSQVRRKCLLTPYVGTIGNIGIHDKGGFYHLGSNVGKIEILNGYQTDIYEEYVKIFLQSAAGYKELTKQKKATAQDSISIEAIREVFIPIPPRREQQLILLQLNHWLSVVDSIKHAEDGITETICTAKAEILDLAIHGKLVPQDSSDEPAIELLKRINPDLKPSDNLHYEDCPAGWLIVPFKEIISLYSGRDIEASRCNSEQRGFPYLVGASCIEGQNISIYRWTEYPEVISQVDDILLSCKGTVGEVILNTLGDVHIARQFMAIRSKSSQLILPRYVELIVKASVERLKNTARGIIPGISREDILEMDVAIPPLTEQKRILSRINEIEHSLSHISLYVCD